jgi:hypothetical protein
MSIVNYSVVHHINQIRPMIDDLTEVNRYLKAQGIPRPKAKNDDGYKARLLCVKWWRRTLECLRGRVDESKLIEAGRVAKHKEKYSSNLTVHRVGKKAAQTADFLKTQTMISDAGDFVDMDTIFNASLANPTNRRAELMIRMAGFEIYAGLHGYVGEFYTLTCPSRFHRFTGSKSNPKYDESTPKQAQKYLVKQWSKIRAAYGRLDIKPFGFRVAEPHHDGCPHWHMLLFVKVEQRETVRSIFSYYALQVDGDELGAAPFPGFDHATKGKDKKSGLPLSGSRFKVVEIDSEVGTATGYIAKYISKNLGFSIDDVEHDTTDKSKSYGQRVKAWASVWGIRQFQQIGGAPVTVWRQLRKLSETLDDELLESARLAADESRWADYLQIMGGVDSKRIDQTISLIKSEVVNQETGELKHNKYFEQVILIFGVASIAAKAITRTKQWLMTSTKDACSVLAQAGGDGAAGGSRFAPWSPVNNCTA